MQRNEQKRQHAAAGKIQPDLDSKLVLRDGASIPDFLSSSTTEAELSAKGVKVLTEAAARPHAFRFSRPHESSTSEPEKPLMDNIVRLAGALTTQASFLYSTAAEGIEYTAAFIEVVRHSGGLKNVKGCRIVELGGGSNLPALTPSIGLHRLGGKLAVVDSDYPRTEGIFVKSDLKTFLENLPDKSVDCFLAFKTLERGSESDDVLVKAAAAFIAQFGKKAGDVLKAYAQYRRNMYPEGSDAARLSDKLLQVSAKDAGSGNADDILRNSTESPEYLRELYALMRRKIKPNGVVIVLNNIDERGLPDSELSSLGFTLEKTGHNPYKPPGVHVLKILKPA